jgi:hypothetical protein
LISGGELVQKVAKQWGGGPIPRVDFQRPVSFDPSLFDFRKLKSIGSGEKHFAFKVSLHFEAIVYARS